MNDPILSIGPLMKAARKFKKFNQAAVATAIGCSQSALSKMEHNLLVPSAPQWFLFSRFTSIPPETLESGVIDRSSSIKFNSTEVSLGFKLPKKYRNFRAQKVRELYPFLQYLEKEKGVEGVKEYVEFTGIDPEFFLDFDNLINFNLFADSVQFFIQKGFSNPLAITEIAKFGQNDVYWDDYLIEWKKLQGGKEILQAYFHEQVFFQTDFQLHMDQKSDKLVLSYTPEYHLKQFKDVNDDLVHFLNQYRKATLENLLDRTLGRPVRLELMTDGSVPSLAARFEVLL